MVKPAGNRERMSGMKLVEVYHFRVIAPAQYVAELLRSIEKVVPHQE
jgi:hypothetical protein